MQDDFGWYACAMHAVHVHGSPASGEYMYSVHGSITFGQRLARSASATTMLTRTGEDTSLHRIRHILTYVFAAGAHTT